MKAVFIFRSHGLSDVCGRFMQLSVYIEWIEYYQLFISDDFVGITFLLVWALKLWHALTSLILLTALWDKWTVMNFYLIGLRLAKRRSCLLSSKEKTTYCDWEYRIQYTISTNNTGIEKKWWYWVTLFYTMDVCQSGYIFLNSDLITFLYNCYCFFFKTVLFIQGCQPLIEESVKQRFKEVSALLFALASVVVRLYYYIRKTLTYSKSLQMAQ